MPAYLHRLMPVLLTVSLVICTLIYVWLPAYIFAVRFELAWEFKSLWRLSIRSKRRRCNHRRRMKMLRRGGVMKMSRDSRLLALTRSIRKPRQRHPLVSATHRKNVNSAIFSISKKPARNFLKFRKANWDSYATQTEEVWSFFSFLAIHRSLDAAVETFSESFLTAGKRHFSAGFVRKYVSLYSVEVKLLMQQRI